MCLCDGVIGLMFSMKKKPNPIASDLFFFKVTESFGIESIYKDHIFLFTTDDFTTEINK